MPNDHPRFGCPRCKSDNIVEVNTVFAEWEIREWTDLGEPEGFGDTEVFYETCEVCTTEKHGVNPYRCRDCQNEFDTPVRIEEPPTRQELLSALQGLFEHCAMIHKHWGEGSNAQAAQQAIEHAKALAEPKA